MKIIMFPFSFSDRNLDLTFTILLTLLYTLFVFVPPLNETPVRIVLGLPLVLFLPGYLLIAILFPRREDLGGIERVALSFGLSIAIVPFLGWALNYTPFGIRSTPVLTLLSTFTISLSLLAWVRRMKLPTEQRFRVPFENLLKAKKLFEGQTVVDNFLSIALIASMMVLSATLVYVVVTPKTGERFTEFYILGPNGTASSYPTNLTVGEEGKVIMGIVNHEYENITYRLEVKFNETMIHSESVFLMHNQTWESPFTFKAANAGLNQKLEFLLYRSEEEEAYRTLHLWVDVEV